MRVLILGGGGQLATELERSLAGEPCLALSHSQADICDAAEVERHAHEFRPDCIVNTAAYHRVDDCEDEVARSFAVNAVALKALAQIANRTGAALVHFSTDYVFDGAQRQPYRETDPPRPLSIYGMSKFAGEQIVRRYAERYFLVRSCGLYGRAGSQSKGGNFVETMLRLASENRTIRVVDDQVATPTSVRDLAKALVPLIGTERFGLYHMTNAGSCSWFEFAGEIFRLTGRVAGPEARLQPISSAEFRAKARRPPYSVLDNAALREAGFPALAPWQEALASYLRERTEGKADPSPRTG
ncbi:MAG TPA: dTDP-4-dehydrorhamnose reductase [Candidatus Dormibacteraeota bacterium]|nr:dTDP-4-dehydrorhamnose reductase [Candidatus Dormibacteraeota bacterium]